MATQLIILYGSSPGAGKSTLASFQFEQYRLRQHPAEWLYEDDVLSLPLFEPVVEAVQRGDRRLKDAVLETAVQDSGHAGIPRPRNDWCLSSSEFKR